MVLEHQTGLHNQLVRAKMNSVSAFYDENALNRELEYDKSHRWTAPLRDCATRSNRSVRYMLFSEEAAWEGTLSGTSEFIKDFSARAIKDSKGRSLRDFDLSKRLSNIRAAT